MGGWGVWFRNRSKNPQIAFFGPNFTFRVPKSHPGMGGWVERFGKGTSPDLANGYELPARIWFDHNSHPIYSNPQELVKQKSVERWASSHNSSSISNWRSVSSFINISLIFSTVRAHLQSFLFLVQPIASAAFKKWHFLQMAFMRWSSRSHKKVKGQSQGWQRTLFFALLGPFPYSEMQNLGRCVNVSLKLSVLSRL